MGGEREAVAEPGGLGGAPRRRALAREPHHPEDARDRAAVRRALDAVARGVLDEQARVGLAVRVDEEHHRAAGVPGAEVALATDVVPGPQNARAVAIRQRRDAARLRALAAVHEQHLGGAARARERFDRGGQAHEEAFDEVAPPVDGRDDRDRGGRHRHRALSGATVRCARQLRQTPRP